MKTDGENRTGKLIYPNRNGTARYLAVSTHTLGPVHSNGEAVLAVKACPFRF